MCLVMASDGRQGQLGYINKTTMILKQALVLSLVPHLKCVCLNYDFQGDFVESGCPLSDVVCKGWEPLTKYAGAL